MSISMLFFKELEAICYIIQAYITSWNMLVTAFSMEGSSIG